MQSKNQIKKAERLGGGGNGNNVKIGDSVQCPECTRMGHIVWISQNRLIVGIQCSARHCRDSYCDDYGFKRSISKANKNSVFLVKTDSLRKP
jgi:hypothetical protein